MISADYCIVAFTIILIISITQWYVDGKKNFTGPPINIQFLQNGEIVESADPDSDSPGKGLDFRRV